MERERARATLHRQLLNVIARGAAAQHQSQVLVAQHEHLDADLRKTLVETRARRAQLRAEREMVRRSQSDT